MKLSDLMTSGKETAKYIILLRSLRLLCEYSQNQTFTTRSSQSYHSFHDNPYWLNIYSTFMAYLRNDCDYRESTISHKELTIRLTISILITVIVLIVALMHNRSLIRS